MPVSIDWSARVIFVPRSFLTPVTSRDYRLDVDAFRRTLKVLEASPLGMAARDTHRHVQESTLSGATYARQIEIINGYRVEFEAFAEPYRVTCTGANHNISDAQVINNVSLVVNNSAGLVVGGGSSSGQAYTPAQIAEAVRKESLMGRQDAGSIGSVLQDVGARVVGSL